MTVALEVLAHCAAILALCLFVAWIATLLVTDPPRNIGSRDFSYRIHQCGCGKQAVAEPKDSIPFGWKSIDGVPECPVCLGITRRAVWHPGEEDEAA